MKNLMFAVAVGLLTTISFSQADAKVGRVYVGDAMSAGEAQAKAMAFCKSTSRAPQYCVQADLRHNPKSNGTTYRAIVNDFRTSKQQKALQN